MVGHVISVFEVLDLIPCTKIKIQNRSQRETLARKTLALYVVNPGTILALHMVL